MSSKVDTMTPRERWDAVLQGKRPDRIPCDIWATSEVYARLYSDLGVRDQRQLFRRLEIDGVFIPNVPVRCETERKKDIWGIEYTDVEYADGSSYAEPTSFPLAAASTVSDIERYPWPDPEWWDYSTLRAQCLEWADYPIRGVYYEPFLRYCWMRGLEQGMMDLLLNPDIVEAALDRIFHIHYVIIEKAYQEAADLFTYSYFAEDLGSQDSLLMSPEMFRKFIKPNLSKMIALSHKYDVKVFHHDDGAIRPLIPELIDIGIDILNPIQWRCAGMEREGLARDFGKDLIFHGAVDNQQTLAFGTPEQVRQEVRENLDIFSKCKGYIVAPCHNIQPISPTENVIALYEAVQEFG